MEKPALKVEDISIRFNLSKEKVDNLKELLIKKIKGETIRFNEFWALKNINFELQKGDRLGILGLNGAGKSTLLKVIAGVYKPTTGKVTRNGHIAPMIELGAGFDPNYTGRENIFLYGSVLGFSRSFLEEKYDEILENVIYEKAKNTAVKFLGYRARSKKELRDKLIKDYDENITDKVISMLEKYGYVNDEEYAKAYVRDCLNLKGWGQKRISLELTKRGIDKNIIEKALPKENTEQLELIEKLLTKRLKGNTNIDFKEKKKHFDYLARRGFLPSDILEVFDKILVKEDW